eukprot:scaffold42408_cov19-Tisochrysis_lutea.AAC.3
MLARCAMLHAPRPQAKILGSALEMKHAPTVGTRKEACSRAWCAMKYAPVVSTGARAAWSYCNIFA